MATSTFTRVSVTTDNHVTSTEKKCILAIVNSGNEQYLNVFMQANKINLKVEKVSDTEYNVTVRTHHAQGLLGAYDSFNSFSVKLS